MSARSRTSAVTGVVLALLVTAGCTSTVTGQPVISSDATTAAPSSSPEGSTVSTPLADRPTSATVSATYDQMQTDIRTAVTSVVPTVVRALRREPSAAGCSGDLAGQGGRTQFLQPWGADNTIPDDQWPAVVTAVDTAIAQHEFGPLTPVVDRAGDHLSGAVGPYGATIQIGTANNVILSVFTGCHPE